MIRERIISGRLVSGLRTKYFPKSRINQGLMSMAPWLNIVMLLIMFMIVDSRLVLQPGVVLSLPEIPFVDGTNSGSLVIVVRSTDRIGSNTRMEKIFFDDEVFDAGDAKKMRIFAARLALAAKEARGNALVIHADKATSHGTLVEIYNIAREANIRRINLAVKEKPAVQDDNETK